MVRLNHPEVTPMERESIFAGPSGTGLPASRRLGADSPGRSARRRPPTCSAGSDYLRHGVGPLRPSGLRPRHADYFPNRADFHWPVMHNRKEVDSGPWLRTGAITIRLIFPTLACTRSRSTVTSPGSPITVMNLSATVIAQEESKRAEDIFTETTAGGGRTSRSRRPRPGGLRHQGRHRTARHR